MECRYNADSDKRRKLALRRRMQTLEADRGLLIGLINTIRESDEVQLLHLRRFFQTDISRDELQNYINSDIHRQLDRPLEPVDLASLSLQRMRSGCALDIKYLDYLYQDPLCDVHLIHQWTSIVDDAAASHLFSLYFNWEHQVWQFIDQETFLKDLNAGRTRFCSPLLVHTVLFFACVSGLRTTQMD